MKLDLCSFLLLRIFTLRIGTLVFGGGCCCVFVGCSSEKNRRLFVCLMVMQICLLQWWLWCILCVVSGSSPMVFSR